LLSEVVTNSLHGDVFDISQFVNPVCQPLLCDTDHNNTGASHDQSSQVSTVLDQGKSSSVSSLDHTGADSQDKAISCTNTYPVVTSLSTLMSHKDSTAFYHKEQNVLNLLEEGK